MPHKPTIMVPESTAGLQARPFLNRVRGSGIQAAKADAGVTAIDLYGDIGFFGVTAADLRRVLNGAKDVKLRINSRGGDVFEGIAIYNDLVDHPGRVDVEISGLAASAASIIAMAGETIRIAESAFVMIHNSWGLVVGNRHDMTKVAEILEGIDEALARIYADRSGAGIRAVTQMMDEETWLSGKKAIDEGFADELLGSGQASAKLAWDLSAYQHVPKALQGHEGRTETTEEPTIRDVERALRDAGFGTRHAKDVAARAFGRGDLRDADREDQTQRDAAFWEAVGDGLKVSALLTSYTAPNNL